VQKRIIVKKGANALKYNLQEIATLAIPLNLKFFIKVIKMLIKILLKAKKVSNSLYLLFLFIINNIFLFLGVLYYLQIGLANYILII
jgi:hypothetical protein